MRTTVLALLALAACEVEGEAPPYELDADLSYTVDGDLPADVDVDALVAEMEPGQIAIVGDPVTGEVATIQTGGSPFARVASADFTVVTPAACINCGGGCPPTSRTIRVTLRHTSGMGGEQFTVTPVSARNFVNVVTTPSTFVRAIGADVTLDSTGDVQNCSRTFNYIYDITAPPRAFVTSTTTLGNFGGTSAADARCQARADAAGLGGTWMAYLASTTNGLPSSRFTGAGPWYAVNTATKVADDMADLTDGTIDAALNRTEFGSAPAAASQVVWTGIAGANGISASNCANWTSTAGQGRRGSTLRTNTQWVDAGTVRCNSGRSLYCFEQ